MKFSRPLAIITSLLILSFLSLHATAADHTWHASGRNGAVVAGKAGSADAGLKMLKEGGNAADAAAATLLALTVTDSSAFCFGGEVPILVYDAKRNVIEVIAGMGTAPRLATLEHFQKRGGIRPKPAQAAVPAALDACITLLDRFGSMTFAQIADPMLDLLEKGNEKWHADLAHTIQQLIDAEKKANDRRQGLRLVADYFYRGPIAHQIDDWSRKHDGLIRYCDLATHVTRIEQPVTTDYRGYTICKCDTWTQGPYLLQTLRLLEGFDLKSMDFQTPQTIHVIVEAMKLALADRDLYYADPLFVDVPLQQLFSDRYTEIRRSLIDMQKASAELRPGDPIENKPLLDRQKLPATLPGLIRDTSTCLVADKWGNVVAATPSGWGGVLAGDTGVWLGSRLISFNIWKDHPNCIQPGKRPRITLTPTIVLKDGKPVLAVSVAGGDTQDQAILQIVTNFIDFSLSVDKLVSTPRYATEHYIGSFNQAPPILAGLTISPEMGNECIEELKNRGHKINPKDDQGHVPQERTALTINQDTGLLHAAGDPNADSPRTTAAF